MKQHGAISLLYLVLTLSACIFEQAIGQTLRSDFENRHADSLTVAAGGKCRTAAVMAAFGTDRLNAKKGSALPRPSLQTQIVSPNGRFVIHYDTTGVNTPALLDVGGNPISGTYTEFAESTAIAFDLAWNKEIDVLGYDPPPSDGIEGGSSLYDVYIIEQPSGVFGETVFRDQHSGLIRNERHVTWIELDNNFAGLRTSGLEGMRVTAAHEFFHAIQAGAYGVWTGEDFYWYELTASWMEDIVYPDIDDYIYDIRGFYTTFRTTSFTSISSQWAGYERAVFAHYLAKRFDPSIVRRMWERIREERIVPAIRTALSERGMSLEQAFLEFSVWNFFTADRADTASYYSEGNRYPRLSPLAAGTALGMSVTLSFDFGSMSQGHFAFAVPGDTIVSVLARTDDGTTGVADQRGSIIFSTTGQGLPRQMLASGWQASLSVEHPELWEVEYVSTATRSPVSRLRTYASPNPWVLSSLRDLTIPIDASNQDPVSVYFVSPAFDVINAGEFVAQPDRGAMSVRIPTAKLSGRIGSGTYTVFVRSSGQEQLLKIAILR